MAGLPYLVRLLPGFYKVEARVPGGDVAGTVEAVGGRIPGFRPGDEVMGIAQGSVAELVLAKPDKFVPKPGRLTFEQAAAVPISGVSASRRSATKRRTKRGRTSLVTGASGGAARFLLLGGELFRVEIKMWWNWRAAIVIR